MYGPLLSGLFPDIALLTSLRLSNIALIESLELSFDAGFTVLTGETGAGKSILLDALDALLGGAHGTSGCKLLRNGAKRAQIEASFLISPAVDFWLKSHSLETEDNELVISREWRGGDGRIISRYRLNGIVVNREQILSLRPFLIDFTVQGQTHKFAKLGQQLSWLDQFGGDSLKTLRSNVRKDWKNWHKSLLRLDEAKADFANSKMKYDEDLIILEELEHAQIDDPHEDQKLQEEQDRLVNGVRLQQGLRFLFAHLKEGSEDFPSVLDQLLMCIHELDTILRLDSSLQIQKDKSLDLEAGLQDLINSFEVYASLLDSNPQRLEELQQRLQTLKRLQRKYDLDLSELITLKDKLRDSLRLSDFEGTITSLKLEEDNLRKLRDTSNNLLTAKRSTLACQLEEMMVNKLRPMGMQNIRFEIDIQAKEPNENGCDSIQFLFSANPDNPLLPLVDVASGGEMSRFLLALKTVLSTVDDSSTMIFDEIDAGVSGRVSCAIAELLKALASDRQVFCITHQPLVAAAAHQHFRVSKSHDLGVTRSDVCKLVEIQDRQREIAELAGGDFAEASLYAASLLDQQAA